MMGAGFESTAQYEYVGGGALDGESADRIMITCVPRQATSFKALLSPRRFRVQSSLTAISELLNGISLHAGKRDSVLVGLGWFERYVEITLLSRSTLRFSGYVDRTSDDDAVRQIERILAFANQHRRDVPHLYLYGHPLSEQMLLSVVEGRRSRLKRIRPIDLFPANRNPAPDDCRFTTVSAGAIKRLTSHVIH